jgi:Beta-propeller repeat
MPASVAIDSAGNLYVTGMADSHMNDQVTKAGQVLTVAPNK